MIWLVYWVGVAAIAVAVTIFSFYLLGAKNALSHKIGIFGLGDAVIFAIMCSVAGTAWPLAAGLSPLVVPAWVAYSKGKKSRARLKEAK